MSERAPGDGTDDDETVVDKLEELAALSVLGVGLVALFLGYSWFWLVFAVGFAVVVPMVHVLADLLTTATGADDTADGGARTTRRTSKRGT